ncbi:MAG: PAS domain-containing protein [Myxococcus sp.]|nr:PAS domain-containing protein [Myxococcus sp.]
MRVSMVLSVDGTIASLTNDAQPLDPALRVGARVEHVAFLRPVLPIVVEARRARTAARTLLLGNTPWEVTCDLAVDGSTFVTLRRGALDVGLTLAGLELVDVLLSGQPLSRVLLELCRAAETAFPGSAPAVVLLGEDGLLRFGAGAGVPPRLRELCEHLAPSESRGVCSECISTKRTVFVDDVTTDPRFAEDEQVVASGVRSWWAWPIITFSSEVVGAFTVSGPVPGLPTERHTNIMSTLVRFAALAIEHSSNERTTRDMLERYHLVAEASTNVIYDWNLRNNHLEWSPRMKQVFGYEHELSFDWWESCLHPADRDRVVTTLQDALIERRKTWGETYRFRRKNGSWATVIDRGHLLFDDAGVPSRLIGEMSDVSGQHLLQARLALTERLASVGTLAAGVAHEINNPLAWITSNLQFAVEELTRLRRETSLLGLDEVTEALSDARVGADRVSTIVRDLKVFSRAPDEQTGLVDVRRVIESAITMARNEIRHRAQLERRLDDVPLVKGNEGKLSQVFLNLLINAAHAVPDGDVSNHSIVVSTGVDKDGNAVVQVRDTGQGISPEVLPQIFDPFFTTKPVGQGTGLGLSICHSIVTSLGGSIQVESALGRGTTFKVTLPRAAVDTRKSPAPIATPVPVARGVVALIDDEPSVLMALKRLLGPLHEVSAFSEARAALEALPQLRPDVIFCDVMMPEMSGTEVFHRLRASHPQLAERVVFMTGGAFSESARDFLDEARRPILDKPFTAEGVRKIANEQVARARSTS